MFIYRTVFEVDKKTKRLEKLQSETLSDKFWEDSARAQDVTREINEIKDIIYKICSLEEKIDNARLAIEILKEEEDKEEEDKSLMKELVENLDDIENLLDRLEEGVILNERYDSYPAVVTIHPGAGGTESQDWAEMLLRMYLRWIERSGFEGNVVYLLEGEEAGIKDVSVEVKGNYAYGYLKAEAGIHRLVRISPFDSNRRRHTSFASVFVYPEVDNDIEIEIDLEDLKIDTYRASGAGGQHVNKTDSAIRITHLPTGIIVQCQNERSQYKNKKNAMKILRSRLYQLKKKEKEEERSKIEESKKDIAWGNQIRSYVFHPYSLVKDHRTNEETGNIQAVMDGDIDRFIRAYLIMNAKERNREN